MYVSSLVGSMLKKRPSPFLLHTAMSLRPSPSYSSRGGRNEWRSRGFSSHNHANPIPPDHNNNNNNNNQPPFNYSGNQSFNPNPYLSPPPFYNPTFYNPKQHSRPRPFYNQHQQQRFRRPPSDYRIWEQQAKPKPTSGGINLTITSSFLYIYIYTFSFTCFQSAERFTVLSYNILADYLALNHRSKLYFHIPPHFLDWSFRLRNILFELGLWSPDILCLQEVDRFQDLHQHLNTRGYNAIWKMRTGDPVDGCAIFWRSSRFKLLHEEAIEFNKFGLRDNVAQICVLESLIENGSSGSHLPKCSEGRNKVVICNIHVLYNPKRGEIKLGQVRILLERAYATSKLWDDAPVVLCGDYNSTPKSSLYNFICEQKLNLSELPRDKISGQYSAEIRPKGPFTSNFRKQSIDNASQSPTTVDNKGELPSSLVTDTSTTHKDVKTAPQLEDKEKSEGSSVKCTSEILKSISSDVITNDNNSDALVEAVEKASLGEDSTSFLSELHGPDGTDMADGAEAADGVDVADGVPFVENQNPFYDPSGWTPMEIEAATGSSECMTMEHHLKLRSAYTEVEDCSGSRDSNGEPQVTSYHRGFQGTVDYIWRSEGLQTVRVLAPIPKKAMEWTPGFPTKKWGSDHIALVAELAFSKLVDEDKSQVQ